MNYILNPNLSHMCLTKIVIQLWTEDDQLQALLSTVNVYRKEFSYNLPALVQMRKKVKALPLPLALKTQLLTFIKPIGNHIYDWYLYLHQNHAFSRINLQDVRWTSYGTIDQAKSAKLLLLNQSLDLQQRYCLARAYCLVEQVQELRQQIEGSNQVRTNEQELVTYFTEHVNDNLNAYVRAPVPRLSPYYTACHVAILALNPVATKFFFPKLSGEEKNRIFSFVSAHFSEDRYLIYNRYFLNASFAELLRFLLSEMSEIQREKVLKTCAKCVFEALLVWPYHRGFLAKTVNRMWAYLRESDFNYLLSRVFWGIEKRVDSEYRDLYVELWNSSSVRFRCYVVKRFTVLDLYDYFSSGETEVCKLLMSAADVTRKEEWLLENPEDIFHAFVERNKMWNFLKFFMEECEILRETMVKLKKKFVAGGIRFDDYQKLEFVRVLDNFHLQRVRDKTANFNRKFW